MPFAYAGLAISAYSAYSSNKNAKKGRASQGAAADAADPFASERPQYQDQLNTLMTGKFDATDPSYKWRFDQGMEATNRGAAASGMLRSGNRLAALNDYGQGQASTEYANQFSRLSQLAGANIGSPAAAGQIIQGNQANSAAGWAGLARDVGGVAKNWWDGLNTGNSGGGGGGATNVMPAGGYGGDGGGGGGQEWTGNPLY